MLRIDRGNGAIADDAIYESLRSVTRNDLDAESFFKSVMQYYNTKPHLIIHEMLEECGSDSRFLSESFRDFFVHLHCSGNNVSRY